MRSKENIGRRVIYIIPLKDLSNAYTKHGYKSGLDGVKGTIVGVLKYNIYQVDFDINHSGHNCDGLAKNYHGFNVDEYFLTFLDDMEIPTKIRWYKKGKFYDDK